MCLEGPMCFGIGLMWEILYKWRHYQTGDNDKNVKKINKEILIKIMCFILFPGVFPGI